MKVYTTTLTALVASIIGFDVIWNVSKMDAFEVFFLAMLIGFIAAGAFLFLTERREAKHGRPTYITDDETGLEYMPMKNGRVA